EEAVVGQRGGVALDAAVAGGDVTHAAGRRHVTGLALLAGAAGGAGLPLGIGGVDGDAEDGALVARGAVAAVAVQRRAGVLAAVHVVERAEEELPFGRAQQPQVEAAVRDAEPPVADARDLVAVIAV